MQNFEITPVAMQGEAQFTNFIEVRDELSSRMADYDKLVTNLTDADSARISLTELKDLRDTLTDAQKELENVYTKPYAEAMAKLDELIAMVDTRYKPLRKFVDDKDKEQKKEDIFEYAHKAAADYGSVGESLVQSPAFFNEDWLLRKYTVGKYRKEVDSILDHGIRDLASIQLAGGEHVREMTAHYLTDLSMDSVQAFRNRLTSADALDMSEVQAHYTNALSGYRVLKISGTVEQMADLMDKLTLMGMQADVLEDGMPKPMEELTEPTFDSFVAFDIETTGTYGSACGDAAAEITEIGAVRVENGVVVDKFDELVNPGRKILPDIAAMTHITNEMVADAPPIAEVLGRFAQFCGDSILVGHNIKSSDLKYIGKAAQKAGIRLENRFLDTYILAKRFKEAKGWEKLALGYLTQYYGITHTEEHRAWSDAEANASVYFELQKLVVGQSVTA